MAREKRIKAIGSYEFCKPMQNGNLMVKCVNVSQVKTLSNLTELSDASENKVPVIKSVMPTPGAKGIIRKCSISISRKRNFRVFETAKGAFC